MPYESKAQERYFNANRAKLEKQGVDVDEWNQASKGLDMPNKVHKAHHTPRIHALDEKKLQPKPHREPPNAFGPSKGNRAFNKR